MKDESKALQIIGEIMEGKTSDRVVKVFVYGIAPAYLIYLIWQTVQFWAVPCL